MLGGDQGVAGEEGHQGRGEGEGGGPVGGEQLQEHRGLEPAHRSHAGHGEQLQLPGQGDGEAALVQHAGHRHVQPEDVVQGQHAHRHLLLHMASDQYNPSAVPCCLLTSWNTLNLGWRYCAICAVRLPWVSSTPFATPVVPLL